jgi:hypothetical protein
VSTRRCTPSPRFRKGCSPLPVLPWETWSCRCFHGGTPTRHDFVGNRSHSNLLAKNRRLTLELSLLVVESNSCVASSNTDGSVDSFPVQLEALPKTSSIRYSGDYIWHTGKYFLILMVFQDLFLGSFLIHTANIRL